MYIKWLIFSCNLLSLKPAVHFLSMRLLITNSNVDSTSPWNIPLRIFASAKLFSLAVIIIIIISSSSSSSSSSSTIIIIFVIIQVIYFSTYTKCVKRK